MSMSPDDGPVLATERRAHALLESALAVATGKEKRAAHRLGRLIADDDGSELLLELTDQVLRIRDPRRAARRLRDLVTASLPASRSTPPLQCTSRSACACRVCTGTGTGTPLP